MSTPAIPKYIPEHETALAAPALRFGLYLPIWATGWTTEDNVDWNNFVSLTKHDRSLIKALTDRQSVLRETVAASALLHLEARAIAPFTTGLGNEHPLDNGFAFLNPYGLPYLPGSGVKGVVRRAAEELAHKDFYGTPGTWTLPDIWRLFGFEPWQPPKDTSARDSWEDRIAGFLVSKEEIDDILNWVLPEGGANAAKLRQRLDEQDSDVQRLRIVLMECTRPAQGALEFWDVIPKISGKHLDVEIMTPHHSHYYQGKKHRGSSTPHDSGKPIPINFLTVPPESAFSFHVRCDPSRLNRTAGHLVQGERWKTLVEAAFEYAFDWLGFGAKTAVGYGAMRRDEGEEKKIRSECEERARQARLAQQTAEQARQKAKEHEERRAVMSPIDREIEDLFDARQDKAMSKTVFLIKLVEAGRWKDSEKVEVAIRIKAWMRKANQWKEISTKKNPNKDRDYQRTLLVKRWLAGK